MGFLERERKRKQELEEKKASERHADEQTRIRFEEEWRQEEAQKRAWLNQANVFYTSSFFPNLLKELSQIKEDLGLRDLNTYRLQQIGRREPKNFIEKISSILDHAVSGPSPTFTEGFLARRELKNKIQGSEYSHGTLIYWIKHDEKYAVANFFVIETTPIGWLAVHGDSSDILPPEQWQNNAEKQEELLGKAYYSPMKIDYSFPYYSGYQDF